MEPERLAQLITDIAEALAKRADGLGGPLPWNYYAEGVAEMLALNGWLALDDRSYP